MTNAELLNKIDVEFEAAINRNKKITVLYQRVRDGTATFESCSDLSIEIGKELSAALSQNITVAVGTDGKIAFFTANEVIRPEMVKGYNYTASYFNDVQQAYFENLNLHIKGAQPDLDDNRIQGFVNKVSSDEYEKVRWILEDPAYLVNYFEAVVDTAIKNNVGMLAQGGIRSTIVRTIDGNACPWCVALAGEYEYPVEDNDVYRRHRDCHCKVTYKVSDGFRQDVWSKQTWQEESGLENRKRFYNQPIKRTPSEARQLENLILNQ